MKALKVLVVVIFFFTCMQQVLAQDLFNTVSKSDSYSIPSTFIVEGIEEFPTTNDEESFMRLSGHYTDNPSQYVEQINTYAFQADIILVYNEYILALDYSAEWKLVNGGRDNQLVDYGNLTFTGWNDAYKKLCELQGARVPRQDYYIDMFYINHGTKPHSNDVNIRLLNTKTGESTVYSTWSKRINRGVFAQVSWLNPSEGLIISFEFYPSACSSSMKSFFSNFIQ